MMFTHYIVSCPYCEALAKRMEILSGNTIGAKLWSDGIFVAMMLPDLPEIGFCQSCENYFWVKDALELGEWLGGCPDEWNTAPYLNYHLYFEDCVTCLEKKLYRNKEEELYLRIKLWHCFNGFYRNKKGKTIKKTMREINYENLIILEKMLDLDKIENLLMKAEINRELGNFDICIQVIDSCNKPKEFLNSANQIKEKAILKDKKLFRIKYEK